MLIEDFSRKPVPNNQTVSGWHIGLIYIGVGIALPAFLMGAKIGINMGLNLTLLATLTAGFILTVAGVFTGWVGGSLRLSTYYILKQTFGEYGAKGFNIMLGLTVFGWFGVTIGMFAQAAAGVFPLAPSLDDEAIWALIGGILMTFTAFWGFKGLDKLSLTAVPIMVIALIWMSYESISHAGMAHIFNIKGQGNIGFGEAVSMMVGGWMVGVSILPDLSRYAKSPAHGSLGAFLCFLPGLMAVITLSVIPALAYNQADFVPLMLLVLPTWMAGIVIILAAWSSNDNNLYASSLSLASLITKTPKWLITLVAGGCGTGLGMLGIIDHFVTFFLFLGIFIPPVAGVYVTDFFLNKNAYRQNPIKIRLNTTLAWAIGSGAAFLTSPLMNDSLGYIKLTTISALDGLLLASLALALLNFSDRIRNKK